MKNKLVVPLLLFLSATANPLRAQTADNYVTQGRAALAATNIVSANLNFSNAVVLSPTNQTANVLFAATRLLVLPSNPAGSNFLNRLGFSAGGRNIYDWTAQPPVDSQNVPLAPAGVDANEATSLLRTNILAELIGAEANLAVVTDTNFTLSLTAQETRSDAVTLDYGDIQLLRALLHASEYLVYNTYSWNLDVQLTMVRSFWDGEHMSFGGLLAAKPSLLNFASTNDLVSAKSEFTNGVAHYLTASQFIRARATNGVNHLFNFHPKHPQDELNFRLTLMDLENSLNGRLTLTAYPAYSVYLSAVLDGTHSPRSFLPEFSGIYFQPDTLPDSTFGGLIYGLNPTNIDNTLAQHLPSGLPSGFFYSQLNLGSDVSWLTFQDNTLFGYYTLAYYPYVYHFDIGFVYFVDAQSDPGGCYLYDFTSHDWWFTSTSLFPYIYDFELQAWLYYYPDTTRAGHYTSNPRYFYNFATSKIITR